jgi:heptosyltransferase-3
VTNQALHPGNGRGILVIHPGAVGDLLLTRPALSLIRRQFPTHEMVLLAGSAVGMLLRESAEVDRVFPLESIYLGELFSGVAAVHPTFKNWLRSCDLVVGWLQDEYGAIANTLRALGVPRVCIQSPFSSDLLSEHQAGRCLEVLVGQPVGKVECNPLVLSSRLRESGRQRLRAFHWSDHQRLVILHPSSGSIRKCMEAEHFAPVVEWLCREGTFPVVLEGPADGEAVARLERVLSLAVPVLRDVELSTVAAVLSHAHLYVGHDSGITHLAAALSVPTMALFGPTSPRRWAPLGHSVTIVTGAPCTCRDWNSVECCREKVCHRIPPARIIEACREHLRNRITAPTA